MRDVFSLKRHIYVILKQERELQFRTEVWAREIRE